jgi:hypothetical protein
MLLFAARWRLGERMQSAWSVAFFLFREIFGIEIFQFWIVRTEHWISQKVVDHCLVASIEFIQFYRDSLGGRFILNRLLGLLYLLLKTFFLQPFSLKSLLFG